MASSSGGSGDSPDRASGPDASRCPLCGQGNACGMTAGASTCWCFDLSIPGEVLERVPADAQGLACICKACAMGSRKSLPLAGEKRGDGAG